MQHQWKFFHNLFALLVFFTDINTITVFTMNKCIINDIRIFQTRFVYKQILYKTFFLCIEKSNAKRSKVRLGPNV